MRTTISPLASTEAAAYHKLPLHIVGKKASSPLDKLRRGRYNRQRALDD